MLLYYTLLSYFPPLSLDGCALYGVFLPFLPFPPTVTILLLLLLLLCFLLCSFCVFQSKSTAETKNLHGNYTHKTHKLIFQQIRRASRCHAPPLLLLLLPPAVHNLFASFSAFFLLSPSPSSSLFLAALQFGFLLSSAIRVRNFLC